MEDTNTPPDKREVNRRSIKIWFRGQVTTIGAAEETIIHEEIQHQINDQGLSCENQVEPFRFSEAFYYKFKKLSDRTWVTDYLQSINWDPWQVNKRYKEEIFHDYLERVE